MSSYPHGTVSYMGGVYAVPEVFAFSYGEMRSFNEKFLPGCYYNRATTSLHDEARNWMVESMRGDWLLMLDTDHVFRPDICYRLVHRAYEFDLDIVSALYQYKVWPHAPLIFEWADNDQGVKTITGWNPEYPLFQVDAAGAGCLLIRKRVFSIIERDWFTRFAKWGEDLAFFQRVKRAGLKAWVDTRIRCHHLAVRPVDLDDLDREPLLEGEARQCNAVSL